MEFIIVIIITIVFAFLIKIIIDWLTHRAMNDSKSNSEMYRVKISYKNIKKVFNENTGNMFFDYSFENSIFGNDIYIHASVVKINNTLFYLKTPIDYFLFELFKNKYIKTHWKEQFGKKISYNEYINLNKYDNSRRSKKTCE